MGGVLALATTCASLATLSCSSPNKSEAVIENIMTRASVRKYLDKPVETEKINTMLRAAMAAPSAVNKQPWHFVVVTERALLDALGEANPHAGMIKQAPLAIVVCGDMSKALEGTAKDYWVQDCSAATENLLLAAHGLGLGAVWTGTYPLQERCEAVQKALDLPSDLVPLNTLVIGYPEGDTPAKDKWKEDNVSWK